MLLLLTLLVYVLGDHVSFSISGSGSADEATLL